MPSAPTRRATGLGFRVVVVLIATVAALAVALALFLPERLDRLSRKWEESRSLAIARLVAHGCTVPLDFGDGEAALVLLRNLETNRGVRYAALYQHDGQELARWRTVPADLAIEPGSAERTWYTPGVVHVSVPVRSRGADPGTLVLGFDRGELDDRRSEAVRIVFEAAALLLAIGIPVAFGAGTIVVNPLRRVTDVARRIASGEVEARRQLPLERTDEVGSVARAIDSMLARLFEKEAGIRALAGVLEQRVAERTSQLEIANREIAARLEELTRTQEQLVLADRHISIGRLAAGVAHEINNPLSYIRSNLEFLSESIAGFERGCPDPDLKSMLRDLAAAANDARSGASRVQFIVRGLKEFSTGHAEPSGPVSVAHALEAAIAMANSEVKHRARLERQIGPLPAVLAHEVRLSQVFLNLLVNAGQAIPDGRPNDHRISVLAYTDPAGWAVVEVSDTGCGMSPEVRAHLFEPFFTTKPVGQGTGLGLSVTLGLVKGYGGTVEVDSAVGRGSTFRVRLPPSPTVEAPQAPVAVPAPRRFAQGRRVLVLDDEALVASAIQRTLARAHDVVVETRPVAALELACREPRFDCILCDVNMPEMSGVQFHQELSRRCPEAAARVAFMTGGAIGESARRHLESSGLVCIEKPLDMDCLRKVIDGTTN